jgi:hypothetical protein
MTAEPRAFALFFVKNIARINRIGSEDSSLNCPAAITVDNCLSNLDQILNCRLYAISYEYKIRFLK